MVGRQDTWPTHGKMELDGVGEHLNNSGDLLCCWDSGSLPAGGK